MASQAEKSPAGDGFDPAADGWRALPNELLGSHEKNGLLSVILAFSRHPVRTINRLTDDQSYRGHWALLWTTLGAQLTLIHVILPHLNGWMFGVPVTENRAAIVLTEALQYIGIAILTPVQYVICKWAGTRARPPMAYVKFCVLSVSFCCMVTALMLLAVWGLIVGLTRAGIGFDGNTLLAGWTYFIQGLIVIFVALSHRTFWGMTMPRAIAVTLLIAVLSWGVVYPLLMQAGAALFPGVLATAA